MSKENDLSTTEQLKKVDPSIAVKQEAPLEKEVEEVVASTATPPLTANSHWKALYREIAIYAKGLRDSNKR